MHLISSFYDIFYCFTSKTHNIIVLHIRKTAMYKIGLANVLTIVENINATHYELSQCVVH